MMKILVDKMPKDFDDCPEHKIVSDPNKPIGENWINGCEKAHSRSFECRQGIDASFVCPYYMEFNARTYVPPVVVFQHNGINQDTVLWDKRTNSKHVP